MVDRVENGYETPVKDGYLNDVTTGDLDRDGRKELVFLETAKNYLDLVRFNAHHKLVPIERWQVFEEHTFRNTTDSLLPEPREAHALPTLPGTSKGRPRRRGTRPDSGLSPAIKPTPPAAFLSPQRQ